MIYEGLLIGLGIFAACAALSMLPFLMILAWALRGPLLLLGGLATAAAAIWFIGGR